MIDKDDKILKSLYRHYEELLSRDYDVAALFLQGSQNYGLDEYSEEYMSDVDTKAIIVPSLEDFVKGKSPVSTTIILDNNEHIDVKDIRLMFNNFKKENISYIELLYTSYYLLNPQYENSIKELFFARDEIVNTNLELLVKCIYGMAMEKRKALCHPYPNLIEKIEKYGYDGKQLSHCARLYYFLNKLQNGASIEECYRVTDPIINKLLINFKKQKDANGGPLSCTAAIQMCDEYLAKIKTIRENYKTPITAQTDILDDIQAEIIITKLKEELKNE